MSYAFPKEDDDDDDSQVPPVSEIVDAKAKSSKKRQRPMSAAIKKPRVPLVPGNVTTATGRPMK